MKKCIVVLIAILAIVMGFTNFALAGDASVGGDGTAIGFDNTNNNSNNNANTNTNNLTGIQDQTVHVEGTNVNINNEAKREHITALPGTAGNFITAPIALADDWKPFVCQPLFQIYTKERLENTAVAGSFSDRKGGFFHKLVSSPIKSVIHVPFKGTSDDKPITLISWMPNSEYELLGEFQCEGYYGWPRGAALGKCLMEAKKVTNADVVFAYYKVRRDPKNSGMSIGTGGGISILGGPGVDKTAGAMSLGGLIGTTTAYVDEAYDWYVLALKGPANPPQGVEVCGSTQSISSITVVKSRTDELKQLTCDVSKIRQQISKLKEEIKECKRFCFNNLTLRSKLGDIYINLYVCTGDRKYLEMAIKEYEIAERNYLRGHDIYARQTAANSIIAQDYYNWAGSIRELYGREAAMKFAAKKKLERIPSGFTE